MRVTTWTLEMRHPPADPPPAVPDGVRIDDAPGIDAELARFLYAVVGGPWHWTDRLDWPRERWTTELAVPGTEFLVAYAEGVPVGYLHLHPAAGGGGTEVEVRYFGLVEQATGCGVGPALLGRGVTRAWSLADRHGLPPVARVWVHTCSLDGPGALATYQRRGFVVVAEETSEEDRPAEPLGAWTSSTGLPR